MKEIHLIEFTTKHGVDTILLKDAPTKEQLEKMRQKWKQAFDIDQNDDYPYVEYFSKRDINLIPTTEEYLNSDVA
jgi:hypothetical protein